MTAHQPTNDVRERPFVTQGRPGQRVSTRTFDLTVLGVRGAVKVAQHQLAHDTGGLWILVRVRLVARREATPIGYAALRDEHGRSYLQSDRIDQPLTSAARTFQPGVPIEGEIAFEVPRSVAARLWLCVGAARTDRRMDSVAEVALPVPPTSTVDGWTTAPSPAVLPTAQVVRP